ncbi:hypothetical protein QE429_003181 [Bacillus sp. SORGH_AS 510]|nr:hypothetical protein [Bacillus sp. SORGH_AS_0510]
MIMKDHLIEITVHQEVDEGQNELGKDKKCLSSTLYHQMKPLKKP